MQSDYHEYVVDVLTFADGHAETIMGNNQNDEVFMREATPKEVACQKRLDAVEVHEGPVNLPELNAFFN